MKSSAPRRIRLAVEKETKMRLTSMRAITIVATALIVIAVLFVLSAQNRNVPSGLTNTQQATLEPTDRSYKVPVSTADVIKATAHARYIWVLTFSPPIMLATWTPARTVTATP